VDNPLGGKGNGGKKTRLAKEGWGWCEMWRGGGMGPGLVVTKPTSGKKTGNSETWPQTVETDATLFIWSQQPKKLKGWLVCGGKKNLAVANVGGILV